MALCSRPAEVVDKTAFWTQAQISPATSPPAVHLSLKGLDGGKNHQQLKYLPHPLRLIWKRCGSSWELICPRMADINLDRAGVVKYSNLFLRAEAKHNLSVLQIGFQREDTCCVRYLCCCPHGAGKVCLDAHTKLCY